MTDHSQRQHWQDVDACQFLSDEIGQSIARRLFIVETRPDDVRSFIARELEALRLYFLECGACEGDVTIVVERVARAIIAEGLRLVGPIEPVGDPACPN